MAEPLTKLYNTGWEQGEMCHEDNGSWVKVEDLKSALEYFLEQLKHDENYEDWYRFRKWTKETISYEEWILKKAFPSIYQGETNVEKSTSNK